MRQCATKNSRRHSSVGSMLKPQAVWSRRLNFWGIFICSLNIFPSSCSWLTSAAGPEGGFEFQLSIRKSSPKWVTLLISVDLCCQSFQLPSRSRRRSAGDRAFCGGLGRSIAVEVDAVIYNPNPCLLFDLCHQVFGQFHSRINRRWRLKRIPIAWQRFKASSNERIGFTATAF